MPKKETIQVNLATANPNLSPATRFGNLVFVAGQTGRHPVSGEVGKGVRQQTHYALQRIKMILEAAGTSLDSVLTVTTHLIKREDLAASKIILMVLYPILVCYPTHRILKTFFAVTW